MTARETAKLMAQFLGHPNLLKTTTLGGVNMPTLEEEETLNVYLTCINDVVQTLGIAYFPLKATTILTSENKTFSYSLFQKPLLQITKVVDALTGSKIKFSSFPNFFQADSNKVIVNYNYQPAYCESWSSDLDVCQSRITPRLIALGGVARFYLINGMFEESSVWNNMFLRAVLVANEPKSQIYIQQRSWV